MVDTSWYFTASWALQLSRLEIQFSTFRVGTRNPVFLGDNHRLFLLLMLTVFCAKYALNPPIFSSSVDLSAHFTFDSCHVYVCVLRCVLCRWRTASPTVRARWRLILAG